MFFLYLSPSHFSVPNQDFRLYPLQVSSPPHFCFLLLISPRSISCTPIYFPPRFSPISILPPHLFFPTQLFCCIYFPLPIAMYPYCYPTCSISHDVRTAGSTASTLCGLHIKGWALCVTSGGHVPLTNLYTLLTTSVISNSCRAPNTHTYGCEIDTKSRIFSAISLTCCVHNNWWVSPYDHLELS